MGTSQSSRGTVHFGGFEVDVQSAELHKQGTKVKLQEQPFQILQTLLEHPGEVVTREELQKRIWPADTFVDFEQGLYNAIKRLREALGDSPENPRFIETLARRGYRFIGTLAAGPGRIESLAVLPLENLSHDPEQEYLAEGLTEALITTLAKVGALRVVSRTTVMHYKGVHRPLREIARELEVDGIVEGTVQRSGERLRISAQLLHAQSDTHLWAESYDRDLRDVLTLQAELAQAIAREVQVQLTTRERTSFAQAQPVDPEAYEAYLKGRYYWNRRSREALPKGVQSFQEAISRDPTYAAAYAGLADCLSTLGALGFVSPGQSCGKAKGLAVRALELEPDLPEAHASLAWATTWYDYDFVVAEREFERSIELNPRYATAHLWFGFYLGMMGRYEEGYTELKRAIRLDPLSSNVHWALGFVYWFSRRYDQAIEECEKALRLDPNLAQAHMLLGHAYLYKSKHESTIAAMKKGLELSAGTASYAASLAEAYAAAGYRDEAQKVLDELQEFSRTQYLSPYVVARVYTALDQREEAFRCLETAYEERAAWMAWLNVEPRFDNLRPDPRFRDLLRRMHFPL